MKTSLKPLWEIASVATEKPCAVIWEPELSDFGWLGRAEGIHPDYGRFTICLNPHGLLNPSGWPTAKLAEVFWHECFHILRGHYSHLEYRPLEALQAYAKGGTLRTTADAGNPVGNRWEAEADTFAALAAERWPTAWLLRQMLIF